MLKIAYSHLKYSQIADEHGWNVAEAWLTTSDGTDDTSAKHLELAIKLAEKDEDRRMKRGRSESGHGGHGRGGGGRGGRGGRQGPTYVAHGGSWPGNDAYMYPQPGYGPPQVPAAPAYFMAPPGPGPTQVVMAMGAPMQFSGVKSGRACFKCGLYGHYMSECPHTGKGHPPTGM